jgi:iron-sulfur cluster repair protein YtfE (RIC family)
MAVMDPATQPLRDEHLALLPELSALSAAADAIGSAEAPEQLDRAQRLLDRHLLPHMAAEEAALYPTIDRLAGTDATATLRHDHDEIRRRIATLEALRGSSEPNANVERELRATLYGLAAIVQLHLAKEEELYYPLLDARLSGDEADDLVTAIHQAERDLYHAKPDRPDVPDRPQA